MASPMAHSHQATGCRSRGSRALTCRGPPTTSYDGSGGRGGEQQADGARGDPGGIPSPPEDGASEVGGAAVVVAGASLAAGDAEGSLARSSRSRCFRSALPAPCPGRVPAPACRLPCPRPCSPSCSALSAFVAAAVGLEDGEAESSPSPTGSSRRSRRRAGRPGQADPDAPEAVGAGRDGLVAVRLGRGLLGGLRRGLGGRRGRACRMDGGCHPRRGRWRCRSRTWRPTRPRGP